MTVKEYFKILKLIEILVVLVASHIMILCKCFHLLSIVTLHCTLLGACILLCLQRMPGVMLQRRGGRLLPLVFCIVTWVASMSQMCPVIFRAHSPLAPPMCSFLNLPCSLASTAFILLSLLSPLTACYSYRGNPEVFVAISISFPIKSGSIP